MTDRMIHVPFLGATLALIDHEGESFVAMRPVVDGIGITWPGQYGKLKGNEIRWGAKVLLVPSVGGEQKALCLPIRKLAGWFMTLHPSRVKPELRDRIRAFQEECDDALWANWAATRTECKPPEPAQALFYFLTFEQISGEPPGPPLFTHIEQHLALSCQMVNAGRNATLATKAALFTAARAAATRALDLIGQAESEVRHD